MTPKPFIILSALVILIGAVRAQEKAPSARRGAAVEIHYAASEIHDAAKKGDAVKVREILAAKPQLVNIREDYILFKDEYVETKDGDKNFACNFPSSDFEVKYLDNPFAKIDKKNSSKKMISIRPKTTQGKLYFYDDCLAINDGHDRDFTPLHFASLYGQKQVAGILLGHKANVNAKSRNGTTALHLASESGRSDIVDLLLSFGAYVNDQRKNGRTPLHGAARRGDKKIVEILLANHADPNLRDKDDKSALQVCVDKECILLLRNHGATGPTERVHATQNILDAIASGEPEKVQAILDEEPVLANSEEDSVNHWSVLLEAIDEGRVSAVDVLLKNSADVNAQTRMGESPLQWAVRKGNAEIVKLLLDRGADVYSHDTKGRSALHEAAFRGHAEIAELLLKSVKMVFWTTDKSGKTPLFYAIDNDHKEVADVLRKHGAQK